MKMWDKIQSGGVYVIAEMSANHGGDLENALKIVRAAKKAGADCLKIQTYTADTMTIDSDREDFRIHGGLWDGYTLYRLYKEAATPWEWQTQIQRECGRVGMDFLSTPFDRTSADFLEGIGVEAYKIASFELVDLPLLAHVARKGKPVLLSCGMGTAEEIREALDVLLAQGLDREQIVLMRCTSAYPASTADMNLSAIPDMAHRFGARVGLSDHSPGTLAPVMAVAYGACVIEKHFCLSHSLKTPDSAFSCDPQEFSAMAQAVGEAARARGSVSYGVTEHEEANVVFRRSLYVVRNMAAGEPFTEENLRIIRPGYGLAPKYFEEILGKKCRMAIPEGTALQMEYVE